ncbi:MAG: RsmD family RNA methyltransferase, partial [Candidatus Berkelbacteria bacterium]
MEQYNNFYFVLGRENKISQTELECVLASFDFGFSPANISILSDQVLEIKLAASSGQVKKLIEILGGTVKIFQKIAPANEKIENLLLAEDKSSKIIFGLSNYSSAKVDTFRMALSAKKAAKKSVRIIDGKEGDRLSSAQSFQYKMDLDNVEYGLFETGIGKLIAVQNINEWTRHDYDKPKSDAKSGMLPPKLARMMVNLAVGQVNDETRINNDEDSGSSFCIRHSGLRPLVVDPFCGSGNVLIEAISVGCDVIGSDLSEKAVSDTRENLEWLIQNSKVESQNCNSKVKISQANATELDFAA